MDRLQDQCARLIHQDSFYRGLTKEELANVKSELSCKQHSAHAVHTSVCKTKHPNMHLHTITTMHRQRECCSLARGNCCYRL